MIEDVTNFGTFIKKCFEIFQIEIFDWGFTFADFIVTILIILAVLKLIFTLIGDGTSSFHLSSYIKPKNIKNNKK